MFANLKKLFDLRQDQHDHQVIDASIRAGVRIGGTNLWVLFFAILIASVGLNVNSAAVIIGAMLISPLMRPILGLGYGAAISDLALIRTSARSLAIFAVLSVLTSTLYFFASPLTQAQSELVARTTPTLWDVLIAFFGGCAGIIAQTRREESTVIPGAAIATALMPPLCTAGYGIATGNLDYLLGAAYLFTINAFFIALSTFLFVKLMGFPEHEQVTPQLQRRAHVVIALGVLALAMPSGYLAYGMVRDQMFLASSKAVLHQLDNQPGTFVLTRDVLVSGRRVAVTLGGAPLPATVAARLGEQLRSGGFDKAALVVRHVGQEKVNLAALRDELKRDLYASTIDELRDRASKVDELNLQLSKIQAARNLRADVINEVLAQYPAITRISVTDGTAARRQPEPAVSVTKADAHAQSDAAVPAVALAAAAQPAPVPASTPAPVTLVLIEAQPALADVDLQRIKAGLGVRLGGAPVELVQMPEPAPPPRKTKRKRKS